MFGARIEGPYSFRACKGACANDEDPVKSDNEIQCSGFNHRQGLPQYSQHCQLYQADQLQHGESFFEADDRYSFYWEYCVQSNKSCSGDYAFTYLSDRYMDLREVREVMRTKTLEDCLSACLDAVNYACRSVSYNRTDGDCFLSQHNQLSKPALIKINNNPNYRIDYYENSCTNNSFTFDYECKDDGIEVKVISKYPYTGAMYGLYDFFTCRIEPKNNTNFEYFFPSPTISKNCSDSIRYKGKDMVLEIVISTDGVEPLYFITPDDLTYQARCPLNEAKRLDQSTDHHSTLKNDATVDNLKMIASAHTLFSMLANATKQRHLSKKHESTEISPINEINNTFLGSNSSSTTFTNLCTTISIPGSSITNTMFTDSSSTSSTITDALPLISSDNKIIQQSVYNTIMTFTNVNDIMENSTLPLILPTTVEFITPALLDAEQNSRNAETSSLLSSISLSSSLSLSSSTTTATATTMNDIIKAITLTETTTTATTTTNTLIEITKATPITDERIKIGNDHSTMTVTLEQFVAGKEDNNISIQRIAEIPSKNTTITSYSVNKSLPHVNDTRLASNDAVIFDIFHNGQPIEAVVVGSKITLSFIPYYAIPPIYMSIKGCQVEPIGSIYEWEREPLAIIKDGCQADHVGLVCPPQKTEYGIRVIAESFRYQTTSKVQYSCLVRICPFSPCPLETCEEVEGCGNSNLLSNTFGLRIKRHITIDDIRAALVANPDLQRQIRLMNRFGTQSQTTSEMQQQLIELSGDHIVKKQLVVVNSEDELRYYVRTGDVP
uniref:Apple domain-containing protein n=1 Tax=Brugia malayi TaxID=6279 RepID=A0A5S6PHW2_BRUMA